MVLTQDHVSNKALVSIPSTVISTSLLLPTILDTLGHRFCLPIDSPCP